MPLVKPPLGSSVDWSHPINRLLVGCWLFNEGAGVNVFDLSRKGATGVMTNMGGSSTSGWTAHRFGKGLAFDGTNDYVTMGNLPQFDFNRTDPFSVSCWVRQTFSSLTFSVIVGKQDTAGSSTGWALSSRAKNDAVTPAWGASLRGNTAAHVLDCRFYPKANDLLWHHLVMTFDGSSDVNGFKLYQDGVALTLEINKNESYASCITSVPFQIGARNALSPWLGGNIENVRVYKRNLSQAEAVALYRNPYAGIVIPTPWKSVWKFTAGSYSEAVSLSGSSSLSGAAGLAAVGALAPSAAAGYASAPTVAMTAALGLSGVAGATLAGGLSVSDSLTLTVAGAYAGSVVMTFVPSVALSGAAGIAQAVTLALPGGLALSGAAGLSSSGSLSAGSALALAGLAVFLGNGGQEFTATFSASAAAAFGAVPGSVYQGATSLAVSALAGMTLAQTLGASVSLTPTADFAAAARLAANGDLVLVASPGLQSVAAVRFEDAVALSAAGVISPLVVVSLQDGTTLGVIAVYDSEASQPFRLPSAFPGERYRLVLRPDGVARLVVVDNEPHLEVE